MKIPEKLQLIQKLSGLTQEKLAQKLNVSFPTLNSWINGKSKPHAKKQALIDTLYKKYTGQTIIPKKILDAKKQVIIKKNKKLKNIIKKITKKPDIYDQFILSLTYNSNSIEGSTLTEPETADILFNNATIPNKTLTEHLEAKNHQSALKFLLKKVSPNFKINEDFILQLHFILMNSIIDNAGIYRYHGVRIVGANIPTANYLKIPQLMKKLILDINKKEKDTIKAVSKIHSRFEQIHPFSDGNGRVGRLLIQAMLLRKNIAPSIIKQEKKRFYYTYLNKCQKSGDSSLLENFICDGIIESYSIIR